MRSQLLAARAGFAALVLAAAIAGAAVAGVRLDEMAYGAAMTAMTVATALGLVALACALIWFGSAARHNNGTGKRAGLIALFGSLLFLYSPLGTVANNYLYPPIHDATSAPDDAPQFVALAKNRAPGMNAATFDGQKKIHYKGEDVTVSYALHTWKNGLITHPHTKLMPNSKDPVGTVFWRSFEIAKSLGWKIVDYNAHEGRIEATAATPWFGQVSDIVIRVRPSGYMGARADVRAQSRTGETDSGFNIDLVRAFKQKVDN